MKQEAPALVIGLLLLAGCTSGPNPDDTSPPLSPGWDECRWTTPQGSALNCEGNARTLQVVPTLGPEWICVFGTASPTGGPLSGAFKMYRNAVSGEAAIGFETTENRASGVLLIQGGGAIHLLNWSAASDAGFASLEIPHDHRWLVSASLYVSYLETEHPLLQNGTMREAWYQENGQILPQVEHVETEGAHYFFRGHKAGSFTHENEISNITFNLKVAVGFERLGMAALAGGCAA